MSDYEKGSTAAHQNLLKTFTVAACREFDDIVIIPYTVGMFRDFELAERIIRAGVKGVPDTLVLMGGDYIFFDAKTGKARFTKEQLAFKERMKQVNRGKDRVYKLTSVEQGLNVIREVRRLHA